MQVLRKQLAAHPYVIGFLMLMLVMSGATTRGEPVVE